MQIRQSIKETLFAAIGLLKKPVFLILSVLLFFTPLVISNDTNELFEFPKSFFIYFLGTGLFAAALSIIILKNKKVLIPELPVWLFLAVNIISTVFSMHPYTSFWGYYTRFNDGLLSLIVFIMIYFAAKNWADSETALRLLKLSVLTIVPVSIIGIFQHYSIGAGIGGAEIGGAGIAAGSAGGEGLTAIERVFSTFGQPNWLAQYLVMLLPVVFYYLAVGGFFVWGIVFILGFLCLWFTYSLSGMIAFLCMIVLVLAVFKFKNILNKKTALKLFSVLAVCFLLAAANMGIYRDKVSDMLKDISTNLHGISEVYAQDGSVYALSDPGFIRFGLWEGALKLFLSSPKNILLGTGPETFPYAFQKFRPESLNYSSEWEYVFNKPHNYYLEILTETGVFGLVFYTWLVVRLLKRVPFFLLPGVAGFLITNIFGWPVTETALLFWVWLGIFKNDQ